MSNECAEVISTNLERVKIGLFYRRAFHLRSRKQDLQHTFTKLIND